MILFAHVSCTEHAHLDSPDKRYALDVSYIGQGALGADYANIVIRSRSGSFEKLIFHGEAQWDPKRNQLSSPRLKWLDNMHLIISYYGEAKCESRAEDIFITCVQS